MTEVHTDSNSINYNCPLHFDYGKVRLSKVLKGRDTALQKLKNAQKNHKKATLSREKDRKQKEIMFSNTRTKPIQPNVWISPFKYPRETFLPFYAAGSQQTRSLSNIPSTGTSGKHNSTCGHSPRHGNGALAETLATCSFLTDCR